MQESALTQPVQPAQKTVVVAVRVEQDDRFVVHPERPGGPDLEELLARTDPARKGEECVRVHLHQRLALTHRVGDEQLVDALVGDLPGDQRARDDADGARPARPRGGGTAPIIDTRPPPVTELPAARGDTRADRAGQREVAGAMPSAEAQ